MDYSRFSHNFYENDNNENDYYSSQIDDIFKLPIILLHNQTDNNDTTNEYNNKIANKLIRNKFTSLNSLKQKYQYLNNNNNCVSEIKLFDNNSSPLSSSSSSNSTSPRITNDQLENTDSFRVNIKELISKFEQK